MHPTKSFQDVKNPADLLELDPDSSPYLFQEFISVDTYGERRLSKRKLDLVKTIHPVIEKILQPDEKAFFVTQGVRSKSFELLFIGWVGYYYNLMAFVFTSERILLVHIKDRHKRGVQISSSAVKRTYDFWSL